MKSWPRWTAAILALVLWQGLVRRATPLAHGTAFNAVSGALPRAATQTLRVAAFNIDGGVSPLDGRLDLNRTASYLRGYDVIGMEEVHGATPITWKNQANILGEIVQMPWLFAPSETRWWTDCFGNAALCSLPVLHWERIPLSMTVAASNRTLLRLTLRWHDRPLTVLITHLGRHEDHFAELGAVIAAFHDAPLPAILMGDLNTQGPEQALAALRQEADVVDAVGRGEGEQLSPRNLDWIFARGLDFVGGGLVDDQASDHRLAWAELAQGAMAR